MLRSFGLKSSGLHIKLFLQKGLGWLGRGETALVQHHHFNMVLVYIVVVLRGQNQQ
jgi:hypothetical protein